jgi:hypothetical protein
VPTTDQLRRLASRYQNIELEPGVWAKDLVDRGMLSGAVIPGPRRHMIAPNLSDVAGRRVLDISKRAITFMRSPLSVCG